MDAVVPALFALRNHELGEPEPWGMIGRIKTASGSGVSIGGTLDDLPTEGIMWVHRAALAATPGATQACTALSLQFDEPCLGGAHLALWENKAGTADLYEFASVAGLIVPLSNDLTATFAATFDAGVASNSVTVYLQGLWLPKGNGGWR